MWLLFALSGPVFWALSTHIDKYLVDRYFRHSDTAVLMVFTSLVGVVMLPPIAWFEPAVFELRTLDVAVLVAAGVCYVGAMLFYLRAIQGEEASVVAPLFQASTLFTCLFGWLFLGEVLSARELGGGALVIAGALLISFDPSGTRRLKWRLVALMLACTSVLAASSVIFKYFAVRDSFWATTFWTYAGEALFGLAIVALPGRRRQFLALFRRNPGPVLALNGANELINLGGGLGVRYAFLLAPVALVSAIASTSTLFVFVFGIALTRFFPHLGRESLARRDLVQKFAAACLMAIGVALLDRSGH